MIMLLLKPPSLALKPVQKRVAVSACSTFSVPVANRVKPELSCPQARQKSSTLLRAEVEASSFVLQAPAEQVLQMCSAATQAGPALSCSLACLKVTPASLQRAATSSPEGKHSFSAISARGWAEHLGAFQGSLEPHWRTSAHSQLTPVAVAIYHTTINIAGHSFCLEGLCATFYRPCAVATARHKCGMSPLQEAGSHSFACRDAPNG